MNPRGATAKSAFLLSSTECFNIFKLIVLDLELFTVWVHSHSSHQRCFQCQQAAVYNQKALINPL